MQCAAFVGRALQDQVDPYAAAGRLPEFPDDVGDAKRRVADDQQRLAAVVDQLTDHRTGTVRRVLAAFRLPRKGEKVRLLKSGTLLTGRGAWVSLEGQPASPNRSSQVVRLPVANTIDRRGLERMLATYGFRSSTPVPEITAWEML